MNWFHSDIRKPVKHTSWRCQVSRWLLQGQEKARNVSKDWKSVLFLHRTRFFDERNHLQLLYVEQFVCWLVGEIKQPSLSRKKVNRCRGGHFHTWESIGGRSVNYIVLLHNYKQSLCMNDLPNDFNSNGGILIHMYGTIPNDKAISHPKQKQDRKLLPLC